MADSLISLTSEGTSPNAILAFPFLLLKTLSLDSLAEILAFSTISLGLSSLLKALISNADSNIPFTPTTLGFEWPPPFSIVSFKFEYHNLQDIAKKPLNKYKYIFIIFKPLFTRVIYITLLGLLPIRHLIFLRLSILSINVKLNELPNYLLYLYSLLALCF
ncbi:hypothetical protein BBU64B_J0035 (plasmid) [Borreliella burgdorferi 64b]|nr:hypothetical protein BBU64B_J0035 [Borreliella burgdorferi 64b]